MKYLFYILIFFPAFVLCQDLSPRDNQLAIGTKKIVHSEILNEDREIWISVPASFTIGCLNQYPVLYLLDGPSFFYSVTGMVRYLSSIGKIPEMIVVGIANTNRVRDLTPTHSIRWSDGEKDTAALGLSGGGAQFMAFIEHELIPYVDSAYVTAPYRMFIGHSLGGLTVLNSLVSSPGLFTSYVAIDPSIWWDNHNIMKNAFNAFLKNSYSSKSLYYASANTMNKGMDTSRVLQDTVHGNIHVRGNLQFRQLLRKNNNGLHWNWKFYPEDNHASIPLIAVYDALRFLFKGYEFDKDLNDTTITVNDIKTHFNRVSALLQYTVLPSESIVNSLGYNFLSHKNYDKACAFFNLNLENYPSSANAYDSMGDFYLETNDRTKASEVFWKALSLKQLPATREKLGKLKLEE